MKKRIFRGILYVTLTVWLLCVILIVGAVYIEDTSEYTQRLKDEANLIAIGVETSGTEYLQEIEPDDKMRVTWIQSDGTVSYDTKADPSEMENHSRRPEFKQAQEEGVGRTERYSDTLSKKTVYYALKMNDESVIRLSLTKRSFFVVVANILKVAVLVLIFAIGIGTLMAGAIARKIVKPLYEIDMDNPDSTAVYDEIRPMVDKISFQNKLLKSRINRLELDVNEKTREAEFRKEFTANVSHELKTPLTSISGYAEIIRNGIAKEKDIPGFADRIYAEAQRLVTLVGDIIKLSQLDENQISARKEKVDLYIACEEQFTVLEHAASKQNIELRLRGKHIYVNAVKQILDEMIYNMCENAVKYNRKNGYVEVNIFHTETGKPALSVSDSGIGIPEEDLERVFERFFRVDKSHSREIGGTGLGLSIVKHAAAYHNASLQLDSVLGEGTKITVVFND